MTSPRLAWIGLGNMGRGMVKNLVEKGTYSGPVAIYNRTIARSEALAATLPKDKVRVATSIGDVVKDADIVFACVANDAAIESNIAEALRDPGAGGKLFVDCSTVHPDTSDRLGQTITAAGAKFVACPVFGAPPMADAGQLVCVLAGPREQVERVRPFCKGVMGRAEIEFPDEAYGAASRLKIVGNTAVVAMVESVAAGHVLAEKSGVGGERFHAFLEALFPGPHAAYSRRMLSGDYYQREGGPAFLASLARKDARHALSLAERHGTHMKQLEVADQHLKKVDEYAGDQGDIAGIYGAVRQEAGLKFENQ